MPKALFYSLLCAVVLLALPFGGVLPWTWSAFVIVVGVLLAARALSGDGGKRAPWPWTLRLAAVLFAAAAAWGAVQFAPAPGQEWPHPTWKAVLDGGIHAAAPLVAQSTAAPMAPTIAVDPGRSAAHLLLLLAYAGVLYLAYCIGADQQRARQALQGLGLCVAAYGLYGLLAEFSGSNTILWFEKKAYLGFVTGPFVNRNSFATYLGLGLLCIAALLWQSVHDALNGVESQTERRRILSELLIGRSWQAIAGLLCLSFALALTQSRGGVVCSGIAVVALFALLGLRYGSLKPALASFAAMLLVSVGVLAISGDGLGERLETVDADWEARANVYRLTAQAIAERPLLGNGLGGFETVFRAYRTDQMPKTFDKAHNDYLELALDLGIPAAGALLVSLLLLAIECARGVWRRRRDAALPALGVAATVLVATHALVDFSLQIPAVAASFCFVLGICVAQSQPTREARVTAPTS